MLSYDLTHWLAFFATAVVLNISPGPDMTFILGHAVSGGRRAGTAAMAGVWTGALIHVVLAALGLSAVVAASTTAFTLIKWVGVAYLAWIGLNAIRSNGSVPVSEAALSKAALRGIYRQGVFIDLLNPKVAIFFLAFLPQFVVPGAGPVWVQLVVHGALIVFVAAVIELPLVFIAGRLTPTLRSSRRLRLWLDRMLGVLFISLSLRLATAEQ